MFDVYITIEGPGGCVTKEHLLLRDFLLKNGYHVKENVNYSDLTTPFESTPNDKLPTIQLKVKHLPWGG